MDNAQTAALAGDSAQPVSDNASLSLDDAVALLGPDKKQDEEEKPAGNSASKSADLSAEDSPADKPADEAEPAAGEAEEPGVEAPEPDDREGDEPEEPVIHGNAKMRLRDGRMVLVADGKRALELVPELERQVAETEARVRKELEPTLTQSQQKQKVLDELLPLAVQAMQAQIPPLPDPSLRETDPLEYHNQKDMHLEAVARFRELKGAQEAMAARAREDQDAGFAAYVKEQQTQLLKARPDLKDPAKAQAFYGNFIEAAQALGVSKEEADNVHDHRIVLGVTQLFEKAKKWDALQAAKPRVAEKQKDAVPVQAPTRRASPNERQNVEAENLSKKLSRTGDLDDAVALLNIINR